MRIKSIFNRLKEEKANSLVENVIILPLIFIIIYAMILTSFMIHDRSTLDAAAKRGTIYAAKCISDPNYASILSKAGNDNGSLDTSVTKISQWKFDGVGENIEPYRYLKLSVPGLEDAVISEVQNIIEKTRIPWGKVEVDGIKCDAVNKIFYQDVTVEITAQYPLPDLFGAFGLPTEYEYTSVAKTTVNDPDEFIRNADLVVDIITDIDNATGNNISKITAKIGELASKLVDFIKIK